MSHLTPETWVSSSALNSALNSFYQLRVISRLKSFVAHKDLEMVIHAFITSKLDYCNSLYLGLPQSSLRRLQPVQNAAAHLLTGTRRREHITPILASLHWLPIHFRIQFKVLLFVFKALNGLAPAYITDLIQPHSVQRSLRSSNKGLLHVPRSRLKQRGDRAFAVAAPSLWHQPPSGHHIRPLQFCLQVQAKNPLLLPGFPFPLTVYLLFLWCALLLNVLIFFFCI